MDVTFSVTATASLQEAFVTHYGLQCGFCTPGMLMSALHLLDAEPNPGRQKIREEMSGNICRCKSGHPLYR